MILTRENNNVDPWAEDIYEGIFDITKEPSYAYAVKSARRGDMCGMTKEKREEQGIYEPGHHTRSFRGSAQAVNRDINDFHAMMDKKYGGGYQIVNVSMTQLADSTLANVTFKL